MEKTDKEQEILEEGTDPRAYELGYLLVSTLDEDAVAKEVQSLKDQVSALGAKVVDGGAPSLIDLAYPMDHVVENKKDIFTNGYFGWFKFEAEPARALELNGLLPKTTTLIRHIILKTTLETPESKQRIKGTEDGEQAIDEKIENLVA